MTDNSKILITGNLGYIGPGVVSYLRHTLPQALLVGLDCGYFAHCFSEPTFAPEIFLHQQQYMDVRDVSDDIFSGVSTVVHLAAISNDPMGKLYQTVTREINHVSTIDIARRAKAAGASSFVFASSCSMYGAADNQLCNENVPLDPLTEYALSKAASEKDLATMADPEFSVTCLRFPTACGMSSRLRLDLVLNDFVANALTYGNIKVLSDGSPWRPLIDVRDMARAIGWAVERDHSASGDFLAVNVGRADCNFQVSELASLVSELCGGIDVSINSETRSDSRSYKVDFSLFQSLTPHNLLIHDIESSIESLKDGLGKMSLHDNDFRSSQWMRLNVLQTLQDRGALSAELRWNLFP